MVARVKLVIVAGCQCAGRHCRPSISDRWLAPKLSTWFLIIATRKDGRTAARENERESSESNQSNTEYCEISISVFLGGDRMESRARRYSAGPFAIHYH
jgi:hypothetical protein